MRSFSSLAVLMTIPALGQAQTTFSIDNHGPTIAVPDAFTGTPITAGDILTPGTALPGPNAPLLAAPLPGTFLDAGAAGLGLIFDGICTGAPAGVFCEIEVDALSYGLDQPLVDTGPALPGTFQFSVDEYAIGIPGAPAAPNVTSEGAAGSREASADVFSDLGAAAPPPWLPFAGGVGNRAMIDGNGLASATPAVYPGLGVVEPHSPGLPPDTGDNVDAIDVDSPAPPAGGAGAYPAYFSLDASFFDPAFGYPLSSSALVHGFVGGDVLVSSGPGGPPAVFASAFSLGLDLLGTDSDDLDALALWENGSGVFEPSQQAYDWLAGGTDMLLFSVRRGSAVIGMPDSAFGIPIEPGDILTTPLPTALGGVSPFPALFVSAESIGLTTLRAGMFPVNVGDDLDALDVVQPSSSDCNGNGIPDAIDIASGTSTDINSNGVPDECELISSSYCECDAALAPCGNGFPTAGCRNSTGLGAAISASGTGSVTLDNLTLTMTSLPPFQFGIFYTGTFPLGGLPFGDGLRCVGGNTFRMPLLLSDAAGVASLTPVVGTLNGLFPGTILPLSTWHFQGWYRDPGGPCGSGFNLTNAVTVAFTP